MAFAVARMMSLYVSLMVAASFVVHCGQARVLSEDVVVTQLPAPAKHQTTPLDFVDPHFAARKSNSSRRVLSSGGTGNPVDDCWRADPNWYNNRQALADCAIGFGRNAQGGKNGAIYVVTDDSDDDVVNPRVGTLRYGVLLEQPLWITFSRNMNIKLQNELIMNSYKTIDGRGYNVHIAGGAGITIQFVSNIILEGIHMHEIVMTGPAVVRSNPHHYGDRLAAQGTAVAILGGQDIWVDHCYFSNSADGLVDAIHGSSGITVSNSYFSNHDEVMLFGAHSTDTEDKAMTVTVAFNHFGPGLNQRIPRIRFGYLHVVNNDYASGWGMYAIGGSESPTILSEGNRFLANGPKEITKRVNDGGDTYGGVNNWNWISTGDMLLNGAFFSPSGENNGAPVYGKASSLSARPAAFVQSMTNDAGPLMCGAGDGYCGSSYVMSNMGMTTSTSSSISFCMSGIVLSALVQQLLRQHN